MGLLPVGRSDEQLELESRLRRACRLWAHARVSILPIIEHTERLQEFDKAMFAVGEIVNAAEVGEVERVERHP